MAVVALWTAALRVVRRARRVRCICRAFMREYRALPIEVQQLL
jgi:hypothetical protein